MKYEDDDSALKYLITLGFKIDEGFIIHKSKLLLTFSFEQIKEINQAINYLIDEWDYGYSPTPLD